MSDYSQKERDFVQRLEQEFDFAAIRAPASGAGTDRELPDVIASRPDRTLVGADLWVFEHKFRSTEKSYFDLEEKYQLVDFAEAAGATPMFAFRWNANESFCYGDTKTYLVSPQRVGTTENSVRMDYSEVDEIGWSMVELLGEDPTPKNLVEDDG